MLFSCPQNGDLTLRKFGDSKLPITKDKIAIFLGQKAIAIRANAIRERAAKRAPAGERERLVAANGIAVCLAAFAMAFYRRNGSNFVLG